MMNPQQEAFTLNEQACVLCGQNKFDEALELLNKAIELDPENTNAWYSKASCLYSLGKLEESLRAYVEVLKLSPDDTMTKRLAIIVESESGSRYPELDEYLDAVECNEFGVQVQTRSAPDSKEALEGALAFYNKAVQLNPNLAQAYNNRGFVYSKLGRLQDALLEYERSIQEKPDYAIAWFNKGQCCLDLLDPGKALICFEKTLELNPGDKDAIHGLDILRQAGIHQS
ncbi:MAG: tetratricopeptide repeat protein [bacterium]|nr:tetratricopeptide repeat protein [bacterium]